VDATAPLEIGGAAGQGPTEFSRIIGVVRLNSGNIVVANSGSSELRVFDKTGTFIRSLGRVGQGPGEFDIQMASMHRIGDTVVATDQAQRAQVYSGAGSLIRSLAPPILVGLAPYGDRQGVLSNGATVVMGMRSLDAAPDGRSDEQFSLLVVPIGTDPARSIGVFPAFQVDRHNGGAPSPVWFGPYSRIAVTPSTICVGYPTAYRITCYDHSGHLKSRTEREVSARRITQADRDFVEASVRNSLSKAPPAVRARVEGQLHDYAYATTAPVFGAFLGATTGDLWVREFEPTDALRRPSRGGDKPLRWSVFGSSGAWLADVLLPARFVPFDIGSDYVAGVAYDTDDIERVTVYRLVRTGSGH
jgi:hypothetical protein